MTIMCKHGKKFYDNYIDKGIQFSHQGSSKLTFSKQNLSTGDPFSHRSTINFVPSLDMLEEWSHGELFDHRLESIHFTESTSLKVI
jgi:hypothetical protein